jgi:hypothetical protein
VEGETEGLDVEPTQVTEDRCDCRGGARPVVTGFVHNRGGDTLAAYIASVYPPSPRHEEEAWIDVILGTWGRDDPHDHVTFGAWCEVGQGCMLVEGAQAAPQGKPVYGRRLTREEGVVHPRVDGFWRVIDAVLTDDPTVSRFYYGCAADGAGTP